MGVTFRSGGYIRFVRLGGRTIKDGEAAAIWNRKGTHRQIIGPQRVPLFFSTIRFLTRFKAESRQYLVVKHRDGKREHIGGPAMMYENPALHDEVSVHDGILLKSMDEYIVVNKFNKDDDCDGSASASESSSTQTLLESSEKKITKVVPCSGSGREIVQGPTLFVPTPNEVVHTFKWSTFCQDGKLSKQTNESSKFHVIQTTLHSLSSAASKSLLSLEFELPNTHSIHAEIDVQYKISEQSIDSLIRVQDPIMKLYQAMQADAIFIGNSISVDDIRDGNRDNISKAIGDVKAYVELGKVAKECGIDISMLRVTKWWMNEDLMTMIRNERDLTARVQSEFAEKEQRQKILQLDQENRCKAIKDEAELKRMKLTKDDELDKEMHEKKMASLERKLALQALEEKAANELKAAKDEGTLAFLTKLNDMDVDLTKYLSSHIEKDSNDAILQSSSRGQKNENYSYL